MSASSGNKPLPPWWVRGCCFIWKCLLWVWSTLIIGVGINVGSSWLLASTLPLAKTPFGWLVGHLALTLVVGGCLLAFTALTGGIIAGYSRVLPSSSSLTLERQNRQRFLAKLQSRYTDLVEQSQQGATQVALTFHNAPNAVRNMTRQRLRQAHPPSQDLPAGTSIMEIYNRAGGDLLILGEPGSGKTLQLLDLAVALREHAALDEQLPLPVIVNLSTWANRQLPLEEWLIQEAAISYDVPCKPLAQWMQQDQLLPLLDGLDEIPEDARPACINTINAFQETHLVPLVVCSRMDEYHTATAHSRLTLQQAVVVQPLEAEQINSYLKEEGNALSGIRSLLRKDGDLRALVRTPLMLHVVTLAYRGVSVQALHKMGNREEQQRQIFEQYIQQRLQDQQATGTKQQTLHYLVFLARQMRIHNQSVFYLEHVQPDWLEAKRERCWYEFLAGKSAGIIVGVLLSFLLVFFIRFITTWQEILNISSRGKPGYYEPCATACL